MRNRSGQIDLKSATLPELKGEIARLKQRMDLAAGSTLQKSFFNRILQVDRVCEQRFGIDRPRRTMPR